MKINKITKEQEMLIVQHLNEMEQLLREHPEMTAWDSAVCLLRRQINHRTHQRIKAMEQRTQSKNSCKQ